MQCEKWETKKIERETIPRDKCQVRKCLIEMRWKSCTEKIPFGVRITPDLQRKINGEKKTLLRSALLIIIKKNPKKKCGFQSRAMLLKSIEAVRHQLLFIEHPTNQLDQHISRAHIIYLFRSIFSWLLLAVLTLIFDHIKLIWLFDGLNTKRKRFKTFFIITRDSCVNFCSFPLYNHIVTFCWHIDCLAFCLFLLLSRFFHCSHKCKPIDTLFHHTFLECSLRCTPTKWATRSAKGQPKWKKNRAQNET